ncbi:hypothetical protein DITRI_Ditri04bG0072800 [Diplodiscus trichospermus]
MMQTLKGRVFFSKYSAAPATWFAEARNIVRRGRSYAASLPSDSPKHRKVSKDERRALIESFVNRYRSVNAGKFPSTTATQKEVGGSYYVVKKVLQELQCKSKEDKSISVVEVVSTTVGIKDETCTEAMNDVKMLDANDKQLEGDGVVEVYNSAEDTFSERVLKPQTAGDFCDFVSEENIVMKDDVKSLEKQVDVKVEDAGIDGSDEFLTFPDKGKIVETSAQHLESEVESKTESQSVQSDFGIKEGGLLKEETEVGNAEGEEKEQTEYKEVLDGQKEEYKEVLNAGSPELEAKHPEQFSEEEKYTRNFSSELTDGAQSWKKSSIWGNLKSFADGIINMWRKL